jgi:hypothetical protein
METPACLDVNEHTACLSYKKWDHGSILNVFIFFVIKLSLCVQYMNLQFEQAVANVKSAGSGWPVWVIWTKTF